MPLKTTVTPTKVLDPYQDDRYHAFVLLVAIVLGMSIVALVLHTHFK